MFACTAIESKLRDLTDFIFVGQEELGDRTYGICLHAWCAAVDTPSATRGFDNNRDKLSWDHCRHSIHSSNKRKA